nr:MAG TPA: hypothetical protein [Caudoviricetes sp.]
MGVGVPPCSPDPAPGTHSASEIVRVPGFCLLGICF